MKTILLIVRWVVGLLFIFSGLVKANDPLGLSYKMQEFFEVWGWHFLNDYTLAFSILMNVFEILAGVAVIIGWQMRLFSWLLLLLIIFFTFLTGYALFSGKIKTCGCFGDCLPLTPAQSFGKDIGLLVLITLLFAQAKKIQSGLSGGIATTLLLLVTIAAAAGQGYVLKHLPFVDCLPYKKGINLLEQMKTPAAAVPDSFSIVFTYKKAGKTLEFDQAHFPADFDSTYEYVDRKDKLVRKGNGLQAKILDMSFQTLSGIDTTQQVLNRAGKYILVFAKEFSDWQEWADAYAQVKQRASEARLPLMVVTADADAAVKLIQDIPVVKCDGTVIKSAARAVPTFFLMDGATVKEKKSAADITAFLGSIKP
jgi:uncharacterized membrane protein YphA (DoxX/SURF4 family)